MKLTSPKVIKSIMEKNKLKFNKNLGQNFLIDESVIDSIISSSVITKDCAVIEIGPGIGSLTEALAKNAGRVICIELDRNLIKVLRSEFEKYDNIEFIHDDILKIDLKSITSNLQSYKIKVVANLPYYITTPILMRLLEENLPLESITVMVQKEVADRIVAKAGSKDYGALSVAVQYHATAQIIRTVPPGAFIPPPNVSSAVVKMVLGEKKVFVDESKFFRIIKASFAQRRKTLINALKGSGFYQMSKDEMGKQLEKIGLDVKVRGESLTIEQFAKLSELIN
jgi:16S rRNA (adenine1518-N6/adenine1519-N6)-dimethyltransferase